MISFVLSYQASHKEKPGRIRLPLWGAYTIRRELRQREFNMLFVLWLVLSSISWPASGQEQRYDLEIPTQPADAALNVLAQQTRTPLLFLFDEVNTVTTNRVVGKFTFKQALDLLLDKTGLEGKINKQGVLTITKSTRPVLPWENSNMPTGKQKPKFLNRLAIWLTTAATSTTATGSLIEEIVITAQKREQNLQEVSISVSAFGGDQLDKLGIDQAADLASFIPNVEIRDGGANDTIQVRGVSLDDFGDGNESPVGFYIDEIYKATLAGQMTQLFDLERVEVLRGPQGTLFGRNTTGGLFHAITRKPTEDFEFKASLQGGSFDQTVFETVISGPLSDSVRGRLSYLYNRDEGWQEDRITDRNFAATNVWALRGQLDIDLSEDISLLLQASGSEQRNSSAIYGISGTVDSGTGNRCSDAEINAGASNCLTFAGFQNPDPDDSDNIFTELDDANNDIDLFDVSAKLSWSLNDNLTLTSITAYGSTERFYQEDGAGPTSAGFFGFVGVPFAALGNFKVDSEQWTQELRFNGSTGAVDWVAGGFYFNDKKDDGFNDLEVFAALFGPNSLQSAFTLDSESWAVFGQADIHLSDALTLIIGARYTEDDKELDIDDGEPTPSFTANEKINTDSVTWRIGLDWQVSDDTLLYANISKGFKSGAFNTTLVGSAAAAAPVSEEEIVSTELGWKTIFLDGTAKFNGSFFYSDYTDLQAVAVVPTGAVGGVASQFSNIGDADIYGAELELTLAPTDNLDLLFTAGWLDTELDASGVTNSFGFSLDGAELAKTPNYTFSSIGIYTFDLGNAGRLSAQAAARWSDEYDIQETLPATLIQDDFWLFDARLTWTSANENIAVSLFGENLGDKDYFVGGYEVNGFERAKFWGKPRTWGLKISYTH